MEGLDEACKLTAETKPEEIAGLIVTKKAELESLLEEEPVPIHDAEKLKVAIRILRSKCAGSAGCSNCRS